MLSYFPHLGRACVEMMVTGQFMIACRQGVRWVWSQGLFVVLATCDVLFYIKTQSLVGKYGLL